MQGCGIVSVVVDCNGCGADIADLCHFQSRQFNIDRRKYFGRLFELGAATVKGI